MPEESRTCASPAPVRGVSKAASGASVLLSACKLSAVAARLSHTTVPRALCTAPPRQMTTDDAFVVVSKAESGG